MEEMIRYPYIDEYIRNTIDRKNGLLKELEEYAQRSFIPIIQPEVVNLLEVLGLTAKPGKILEIGTAIGYSAIVLAGVLGENGRIDTIEISEQMSEEAKRNLKRAGMDHKVNVLLGDAYEVLLCLNKKYDMIFMDASKGQYIEFFPECMRMLNPGGLLVTDNILYKGLTANRGFVEHKHRTIAARLKEYLDMLCSHPQLKTSIVPIGDGVALSYKINDK